jgi:hypothetical protein
VSRLIPFPALSEARRRHRPLIAAAGRWALSHGVPLPADHIALWATTAEEAGYPGSVDGITGPWRASLVPEFLERMAAWCTRAGCPAPADLAPSLWHLYGFLAGTRRLHPAGDHLRELRAAIAVFAHFDRFESPDPPPAPIAA